MCIHVSYGTRKHSLLVYCKTIFLNNSMAQLLIVSEVIYYASAFLSISPLANLNPFMHHCKHTIKFYNTSHFFVSDHITPSAFLKVESRIWTYLILTYLYVFYFMSAYEPLLFCHS